MALGVRRKAVPLRPAAQGARAVRPRRGRPVQAPARFSSRAGSCSGQPLARKASSPARACSYLPLPSSSLKPGGQETPADYISTQGVCCGGDW